MPVCKPIVWRRIRSAKSSRDQGVPSFQVFHLPKDKAALESWITYWTGHCGEHEGVDFFLSYERNRVKVFRAVYQSGVRWIATS